MSSTKVLLAALVLGAFLVTGPLANEANPIPQFVVFASTEERGGGGDEGGGGNEDNNEGSDEGDEGGGGSEDDSEPEPEPEPPRVDEQPTPAEPLPGTAVREPIAPPPEPEVITECQEGFVLSDIESCIPEPVASSSFVPPPGCEGLTPLECLGVKVGVPPPECANLTPLECLEDYLNKPTPPVNPPVDRVPLPYCDKVPNNYQGSCHDRQDFDDVTGLYPCNDGTQEADWRNCADASEERPYFCQALGCPRSPPDPVHGCFDGRDPVNGFCPEPTPPSPIPFPNPGDNYDPALPNVDDLDCKDIDGTVRIIGTDPYRLDGDGDGTGCEPFENGNGNGGSDDDEDVNVTIKRLVKIIEDGNNHGHNNFPEIDIIGLSIKEHGNAMMCLMNIDDSHIQCQEFGMEDNKVNQAFWRIIETDHDKDYDNGNTGSNDVDLAIDDIKSQDFDELDDDRDNHGFGIDLVWVAINPVGDGVTCLAEDSTGKGKSLCEPFKVSTQEVAGQITEGVEFS